MERLEPRSMALKLLRDAAWVCIVQVLRGYVARTYAAGVEAPHDRAVEVLPPIDSSNSPLDLPSPSGAAPRTDITGTSAANQAARALA